MAQVVYHVHVAGFSTQKDTLDEVRTWVNDLRRERDLTGETLDIYKGERYGMCEVYKGVPDKRIVLEALPRE